MTDEMKVARARILAALEAHSDASVVMRAHASRIVQLLDELDARIEATRLSTPEDVASLLGGFPEPVRQPDSV